MTFLQLQDDDSRDLALELFYAGDAPDLDSAAALAADMQDVVRSCTLEWDWDVGEHAARAFEATGEPEAFDTMVAALPF